MCTVTLVPLAGQPGASGGLRLMCNRDESRTRSAALPPIERSFGRVRAVFPVDADSGGTWIAVSDAGLVMTLLNRNPVDTRGVDHSGKTSRGKIITSLLHSESLAQAREVVQGIDSPSFSPFRLVIADAKTCVVVAGGGGEINIQERSAAKPLMYTSSGLGDGLVEEPRRALFDRMFDGGGDRWLAQQEWFHKHRWAGRPELSVAMAREDAETVSVTTVELSAATAVLSYLPASPLAAAEGRELRIELSRADRP